MSSDKLLKVAMSGATGFIGTNLSNYFKSCGFEVIPIGRKDLKSEINHLANLLESVDVVINLAGAPILAKWTRSYKATLYDSRILTTRSIVNALNLTTLKPRLLISTSAVGIYDSLGEHSEDSHAYADNFLGSLAQDWEAEALKASELNIKTIIFRFGIVLSKNGGALQVMIPPFKLGLGGTIGDGRQSFSWVHVDDLIRAFEAAVFDSSFHGIYNLTAPHPTTNKVLTKVLGTKLRRPAFLKVPYFVLKAQYGEGAQVLTQGQKVIPKRLIDSGFEFKFPTIEMAIENCVGK